MFGIRKAILLSIIFIVGLLSYKAHKSPPIPIGDAEDYWEFACGIETRSFDGYFPFARWTGVFPKTDGWYFYYFHEHHGRHVFKVSAEALLAQIAEVYSLLNTEIRTTVQHRVRDGEIENKNVRRLDCLKTMNLVRDSDVNFIDEVNRVRSSVSTLKSGQKDIDSFLAQWERSKRYWASILFEAVFLCVWWGFTFHKNSFGRFNERLDIRIAFSPLLLFLPHFIGYAPFLFTSGPSGGIIYPFFAMLVSLPFGWIPFNPVETWFLEMLPQPLSYISQVPTSPLALSFQGAVSPTVLIGFAVSILLMTKLWRYYRREVKR